MAPTPLTGSEDLSQLILHLDHHYYQTAASDCELLGRLSAALAIDGIEPGLAAYARLCHELATSLGHEVSLRSSLLLPYVQQLHQKATSGHDCSACSGACKLGHGGRLVSLAEGQARIRQLLDGLSQQAIRTEAGVSGIPNSLRSGISRLQQLLSGMLQIEEAMLMPRMREAQSLIHAIS